METDVKDRLRERADLVCQLREHFSKTCTEVWTPRIEKHPAFERIPSLKVSDPQLREGVKNRLPGGWLTPHSEMGMVRLAMEGSGDVFQVSSCFRAEDFRKDATHSMEFITLEWVRLNQGYKDMWQEVSMLMRNLLIPGKDFRSKKTPMPGRFEIMCEGLELANCYSLYDSGRSIVRSSIRPIPEKSLSEEQIKAGYDSQDAETMLSVPKNSITGAIGIDRVLMARNGYDSIQQANPSLRDW